MDDQEFRTAALVFAHYLGIDLDREPELVRVAEDALEDLPPGWELGIGEDENKGIPYYFNTNTNESVWQHPLEDKYRHIVEEERNRLQIKRAKKKQQQALANERSKGGQDEVVSKASKQQGGGGRERSEGGAAAAGEVMEVQEFGEEEAAGRSHAANQRPKFGMSPEDFLDDPNKTVKRGSGTSASNAGALSGRDRSPGKDSGADVPRRPSKEEKIVTNTAESYKKPEFQPVFSDSWLDAEHRDTKKDSRETGGARAAAKERPSTSSVASSQRDRDGSPQQRPRTASEVRNGRESRADRNDFEERRASSRASSFDRTVGRERDRDYTYNSRVDRENRDDDKDKSLKEEHRRFQSRVQDLEDDVARYRKLLDETNAEKDASIDRLRKNISKLESEVDEKQKDMSNLKSKLDEVESRAKRDVKEAEDATSKQKDVMRALRLENDELKDRTIKAKKMYEEDIEEARAEQESLKRRLSASLEEAEELRKKFINSKEIGRDEVYGELENTRSLLRQAEEKMRQQSQELKKLRDEHASLAVRASGALQSAQISVAESEAAKSQAAAAMTEAHTSNAALQQAAQRMQQLDGELAKTRAENAVLRKEIDAMNQELRKYQAQSFVAADGVTMAESEAKRSKSLMQNEISRLSSRCSELTGLNSVLQREVDMAEETRAQAVREVTQQLMKTEGELHSMSMRLHDADERYERAQSAIAKSDADIRVLRDTIQKRDRTIRELTIQKEEMTAHMEEERTKLLQDIDAQRKDIMEWKSKVSDAERKHRQVLDAMQEDISNKVPQIAANAAAEAERICHRDLESKISALRSDYELKLEQKTRELSRAQTSNEESLARIKVANADDKAELERMRFQNRRLQKRCDELEAELDGRSRRMVVTTPAPSQGPQYIVVPSESGMRGINQTPYVVQQGMPIPQSLPQEEQQYLQLIQNEIQGIKSVLSRSAQPTTPYPMQGIQNIPFANNIQTPFYGMTYPAPAYSMPMPAPPSYNAGVQEAEQSIRNRDGQAWAELLGKQQLNSSKGGNANVNISNMSGVSKRAVEETIDGYSDGGSIMSMNLSKSLNLSELRGLAATPADGGYHAGYWKSKYMR